MLHTIWYHLDHSKNVKNADWGVLLSVKFQALACTFTNINTAPWMLFTFLKLYKWYQIMQRITYPNNQKKDRTKDVSSLPGPQKKEHPWLKSKMNFERAW